MIKRILLASENYHDADSDKKTAYTQAVTNAENILNKNSGSNLDKAAVEKRVVTSDKCERCPKW